MWTSGTAVTLQLLQGPTKALVSSALAAGIGADLLLAASHPAQCYTFRAAYDDDIFKDGQGSAPDLTLSGQVAARLAHPYTKQLRPTGLAAFQKLFSKWNIPLTVLRNIATPNLLVLSHYFTQLHEEELRAIETGEEPVSIPMPSVEFRFAFHRGCINACLDLTVQVTRILLDTAAKAKLSLDMSRRLLKELKPSAIRKGAYPFHQRCWRVARTAFRSEATLYVADWIVACGLELYLYLVWKAKVAAGKQPAQRQVKRLLLRCALQGGRCAVVLTAVSAGNGVGSVMSDRDRSYVMFLCAYAASFAANTYMNALIARWTALPPPPGEPAAISSPPQPPPVPPQAPVHPLAGLGGDAPLFFQGGGAAAAAAAAAAAIDALAGEEAAPEGLLFGDAGLEFAAAQQQEEAGAGQGVEEVEEEVPAPPPPAPAPRDRRPVVGLARLPERRRPPAAASAPATPQFPREPRVQQAEQQPWGVGGEEGAAQGAAAAAAAAMAGEASPAPPGTPPTAAAPSSSAAPDTHG